MQDIDLSGVSPVQLILLMVFLMGIFSALSWGVLEAFRRHFRRMSSLFALTAALSIAFYFAMKAVE